MQEISSILNEFGGVAHGPERANRCPNILPHCPLSLQCRPFFRRVTMPHGTLQAPREHKKRGWVRSETRHERWGCWQPTHFFPSVHGSKHDHRREDGFFQLPAVFCCFPGIAWIAVEWWAASSIPAKNLLVPARTLGLDGNRLRVQHLDGRVDTCRLDIFQN